MQHVFEAISTTLKIETSKQQTREHLVLCNMFRCNQWKFQSEIARVELWKRVDKNWKEKRMFQLAKYKISGRQEPPVDYCG